MRPLLAVLTGFLGFWPTSARPETLTRSFSYFTISGDTPLEIERQLAKLGPTVDDSASRHPGATRIQFAPSLTYARTPGNCSISAARVALKADVILPRWRRKAAADISAQLFWDVLSTDIVRHEEAHLVIARNHARQLERQSTKLRPRPNCEEMGKEARLLQDRILAKHDTEQKRLDRAEAAGLDRRLISKLKRRIDQMTFQEPPS